MSESLKGPQTLTIKGFYFAPEEQAARQNNNKSLIIFGGFGVVVAASVAFFLGADDGGDGSFQLGTDRPAGEDEFGRRVREREGWRSREAAEPAPGSRNWSRMTDATLLQYYEDNYSGVSRGKLKQIDQSFYLTLRKRGLLDEVPFASGRMNWASMSDAELLEYYDQQYGDKNFSRGRLAAKNPALYQELWRRGLIDEIALSENQMRWSEMTDAQLLQYYYDNYPNYTRAELAKKDSAFYQTLRRRDLIQHIPTAQELKRVAR